MSERIRWGILGTGMIAKQFAGDLRASETCELVATGSRSPDMAKRFAGRYGGEGFGSYESVLEDERVDAVYVSLPNAMHREWTIRSLESGKHVLCEKPMALTAWEAEEMFKVAEREGNVLIEAFMFRAHPQMAHLLRMVREERVLGDLRFIRSNFTFARAVDESDARYADSKGGGSIMDVGCYCVNFARAITGIEPTDLECFAHVHEHGVDDYAAGVLRFGENILMTFTCGMTVRSDARTFVAGTEGTLELERFWFCRDAILLGKSDGSIQEVRIDTGQPLYALEADAFAEAVRGGVRFVEPADTMGNMRVLDALRRKAGFRVTNGQA
ncbi:MAG: Gfo/Idh/MocA family oxidoreductase [Verrucomicrobiota bacterium]